MTPLERSAWKELRRQVESLPEGERTVCDCGGLFVFRQDETVKGAPESGEVFHTEPVCGMFRLMLKSLSGVREMVRCAMTWVKLEVGDNWGDRFYTYPGERLNESGTNVTENALVLREGMETVVRFPDDCGAVVRLESKPEAFRYYDMGHECSGNTKSWGFLFDVHGVRVWIGLEEVEVVLGFAKRARESKEEAKP